MFDKSFKIFMKNCLAVVYWVGRKKEAEDRVGTVIPIIVLVSETWENEPWKFLLTVPVMADWTESQTITSRAASEGS